MAMPVRVCCDSSLSMDSIKGFTNKSILCELGCCHVLLCLPHTSACAFPVRELNASNGFEEEVIGLECYR